MPDTSPEPINSHLGLVMKLGISDKNTLDYKSTLPTLLSVNSKLVIICNNNCPLPITSSPPCLQQPHIPKSPVTTCDQVV